MTAHHDFLNPLPSAATLDTFGDRRRLLAALQAQLPNFTGTLLDVGCGEMPYKSLLLQQPARVTSYLGLDLPDNGHGKPDLTWDGRSIPLGDAAVDCAIATEVFEHCPAPETVMREILRVLRPDGFLFFTVPFLWPIHCAPHDEYRYTPFALERHLRAAGFGSIQLRAQGGWDASLAQMLGLWARRRPMGARSRQLVSWLLLPFVRHLSQRDQPPPVTRDQTMLTGISGTARKPLATPTSAHGS